MKRLITTIKISKPIVEKLSKLKIHPRQSYEEVIVKLLESYKQKATLKKKQELTAKKEITTIKLSKEVVKRLSELKIHPRQAYEEVIVTLLSAYKKND